MRRLVDCDCWSNRSNLATMIMITGIMYGISTLSTVRTGTTAPRPPTTRSTGRDPASRTRARQGRTPLLDGRLNAHACLAVDAGSTVYVDTVAGTVCHTCCCVGGPARLPRSLEALLVGNNEANDQGCTRRCDYQKPEGPSLLVPYSRE